MLLEWHLFFCFLISTWQRNGDYITRPDRRVAHSIDIHDIGDRRRVAGSDGSHSVTSLDNIREVDGGKVVVGGVEAGAGKGDEESLPDVEGRRVGNTVGLTDLVGRGKARENGVGDGGEGVGGAGLVAGGDGLADAVGAGAEGGDVEEEADGEDVVLNVGDRDVDRVGCEDRNGVGLEEGGHLGDLEVSVEGVAEESRAGVGAGAGLDDGLGEGEKWERQEVKD